MIQISMNSSIGKTKIVLWIGSIASKPNESPPVAETSYNINLHTKRSTEMKKNKEVNIAFRIWDQITQLESILWDRYCDEFLDLTIKQDDANISQDDSQDVNDHF